MKILKTTLVAATLFFGAQNLLRATDAVVEPVAKTNEDKAVDRAHANLKNDQNALNTEREERNAAVKDLRKDNMKKASAESELQKDKEEGNSSEVRQDKRDLKHANNAVSSDKKELAGEQKQVNKAKAKVRKSSHRLKHAKAAQKVENAE